MSTTPTARTPARTPAGAPASPGAPPGAPAGSDARSAWILTAVAVSQLMVVLDASVVNIALPDIRIDLGFSATGLSWVLNAYTLTFGGLLLLGGRIGDILGRRRIFLTGVWIFTGASLLAGLAPNAEVLVTGRALQGVGAAISSPTGLALLATTFTGAARAKAIGVYGAVSGAGGVVGMILGGAITQWANWRWTMFVNIPIGVFVAVVATVHVVLSGRASGRFDIAGAVLSTLGVTVLTYALIRSTADGWGDVLTVVSIVVGVVLLGGTIFAIFFFVTQFLQNILHMNPFHAGLAFVPWGLGIFGFSQLVARLTASFGIKPVLVTGALCTAGATVWLTQISEHSCYIVLALLLAVFGLARKEREHPPAAT